MLTAGCLFSGMGGFASGLAGAGFGLSWAVDENARACAAFRHRLPGVRVLERDVRGLGAAEAGLEPVDLLAAGFPCQSFSQAGDRRGFEDRRGEVFFEIPRLLGEWAPHERPKLVVLENVDSEPSGEGVPHWSDRSGRAVHHHRQVRGPSEREECLAEARATTEARRLDGWFSSQYEEDTFRRQQEAWCRTLYD